MIYKEINDPYYFWNWLKNSDSYSNSFSLDGAKAVFDYFDNLSEELDENISFDPIAWCVEFSEYDSAFECATDHGYEEAVDLEPHGSVDLLEVQDLEEAQAKEWLQDRTTVIELEKGRVVVGEF